ncbi:sulfatase-like hydrolase/transferase [Haloarchaeobius amylolyticus]|uniref:sulfatase-like hydrolase/transferase n=1 Tax=Haloarchaeobius amylolyticus TaxID=1198296 RepID=UPI00226F2132
MTRNVVLVVLDTVRKDTFDEYAPRLRNRAGSSFEQCRAASSWSTPSHTSMFTGELPHEHGVHAEHFDSTFDFSQFAIADTFLGDLPDHRTVGLSANSYINPHFGFDALFDEFYDFSIGSHTAESLFTEGKTVQEYMKRTDEPSAAKRYVGFLKECLEHDRPAKSLANGVWALAGPKLKRMDVPIPEPVDDGAGVISDTMAETVEDGTEPTFVFANYMDAHTPLRNLLQHDRSLHSVPNSWSSTEIDKWELNKDGLATEEYTENYREVYAAAVDYLDRTVSDLVDRLQAATDRETTVVVTADHGHNLGYEADDDLFHHTGSMSEGVMHTPLEIINPPEGYPAVEDRLFSHLHLGDLLVDLAHERPLDEDYFHDRIPAETVGLLGGDNATWGREFDDEEYAWWNRMMRVVYEDGTKRQWNSLGESFRYRLDPDRPSWQGLVAEDVDIPEADREWFDVELAEYKRSVSETTQDTDFDDEVEDHLKQLGYL